MRSFHPYMIMIRHACIATMALLASACHHRWFASAFVAGPNPAPREKQHRRALSRRRVAGDSASSWGAVEAPTTLSSLAQRLAADDRDRIDRLVCRRTAARRRGDYERADAVRDEIARIRVVLPAVWDGPVGGERPVAPQETESVLKCAVFVTDLPRTRGGGSTWELRLVDETMDTLREEDDVLRLSHAALGQAVAAADRGVDADNVALCQLVRRANDRLQALRQRGLFPGATLSVGELHGRKAADAALWFALAGVGATAPGRVLCRDLADVAAEELQRFGRRSSCRAKDVLHIVERVAMAGVVGESADRLYAVAADCLEAKMGGPDQDMSANDTVVIDEGTSDYANLLRSLRDSSFDLHSDRPLLCLWRFSTRQRKQRAFFRNAARHFDTLNHTRSARCKTNDVLSEKYDWSAMFEDPSRPLVVDVGCGMGVSILGLASVNNAESSDTVKNPSSTADSEISIDWSGCNFLGVDLSCLAIGYARGVCSHRKHCGNRVGFVVDSAEDCLASISDTYPGNVTLAMLQFPTPYRFQSTNREVSGDEKEQSSSRSGGNSQLPAAAASDDFMVTERLLLQIHCLLRDCHGRLLLQSNCEDVAVHLRHVATKHVGFRAVMITHPAVAPATVTQRAQRWAAAGGTRACGDGWSAGPLLPAAGRTETEAACVRDGKPVHRCMLTAS